MPDQNEKYRIGIDVGGTFTDVVLIGETSGSVRVAKLLNADPDRSETVLRGIRRVLDEVGIASGAVSTINHGTTITTNAVIERKGARTALITNQGFRDIVEIGRFGRPPDLIYRVHEDKPQPFVERALRLGVACRIDRNGAVASDLDEAGLEAIIALLRVEAVEAVAVCFLFSFLNPTHEEAVKAALACALPNVQVVLSSEILREFREFPRSATTIFAAYVAPVLRRYVGQLTRRLSEAGIDAPLRIFQSNGGIAEPDVLMRNPALTLLSGPAGAVVGAAQLCGAAGFHRLITMDIGGTSLDVCVVRDGQFETTRAREIDFQPVAIPMINVHTVGAGGGSIVRVDPVGRVTVGPDSVAANPGPACYAKGGTTATLTDVNMVLGLINPASFAGGEVSLAPDRSLEAIGREVATPLGLDVVAAAAGVYRVATNQIAEAIRKVTVEGGHDPAEFALVAFGGGGPLHACSVAREVGIPIVVVPRHPGLFSARGIALSDFFHDHVQSVMRKAADLDDASLMESFAPLQSLATRDLDSEGIAPELRRIELAADLRYVGQSSEITVPVRDGQGMADIVARFHQMHEQLYAYAVQGEPVEVVNVRLRAVGMVVKPPLTAFDAASGDARATQLRQIHDPDTGRPITVHVHDRASLSSGAEIAGPALVEESSSTSVLLPGCHGTVDRFGNLVIKVASA